MRSEYYGSVRVTYFEKERVWTAVRELASELSDKHPEITKIAVFGSLVRDEAAPGSDVDVLLVLDHSDAPFTARPGLYRPAKFPVGLDIFAYTAREAAEMLAGGNQFLRTAFAEAKVLFER